MPPNALGGIEEVHPSEPSEVEMRAKEEPVVVTPDEVLQGNQLRPSSASRVDQTEPHAIDPWQLRIMIDSMRDRPPPMPTAEFALPPNYPRVWSCDSGFRRTLTGCSKIDIPANAHLNYGGNSWSCDSGYKMSGLGCTAMSRDELEEHERAIQLLLAEREARRGGVSGDDCEREYDIDARVCVSVENASLDCDESYLDNFFNGCEVSVSYTLETDYEGDETIHLEVECEASISYEKGGAYPIHSSDSASEDEYHDLSELDSTYESMQISFDFSTFDEVRRVALRDIDCEIYSVSSY